MALTRGNPAFAICSVTFSQVREDISETINLSQQEPEQVNRLLTILEKWRKETNAPVPDQLNPEFSL